MSAENDSGLSAHVAHIFARNFQLAQTSPRWMSEFMIDLTQAVAQFHETTEIKIRIKVKLRAEGI